MNELADSQNDDTNEYVRTLENDEIFRNDDASGKVERLEEETKDLKLKILELQKKLELLHRKSLKKDDALKSLRCKKDRLEDALRIQKDCNKNLCQELDEEKTNSTKERQLRLLKNGLSRAKQSIDNRYSKCEIPDRNFSSMQECLKEISRLEKDNCVLRASLKEQTEKTYNICVLYMRLKHSKDSVLSEIRSLSKEFDEVSNDMIEKLTDARNEINNIADSRCHESIGRRTARMLRFAQRNGQLVLENSTLRLEISRLKRSLAAINRDHSLIKINTHTLEVKTVASKTVIKIDSEDEDPLFYTQGSAQREVSRENLPKYYTKYSQKHKHEPHPWDANKEFRNTNREELSPLLHKVRIPKLHIPLDPGGDRGNRLEKIPRNQNNAAQESIKVPNHWKTRQRSKYRTKSNDINGSDSTDAESTHLQRTTKLPDISNKVPLVNKYVYTTTLVPSEESVTEEKIDDVFVKSSSAEVEHKQREHETTTVNEAIPAKQMSEESVYSCEYYMHTGKDASRSESAPGLIETQSVDRYITLIEEP